MKEYKIKNSTFSYPESFEKVLDLELYNFDIWFIMDSEQATSIYNGMKKRYPNRNLFPFAKRVDNDDTACFELEKGTNIQIIHDFAEEGYEQREEYNDFWEWFNNAIKEMIEYNRCDGIGKFEINIPHFYCLEYIENNKRLYLDIDFREPKILIGKSLIVKWEPPYDHIEISKEDRERIYFNVINYLLERYSQEDILEIY